MRSFFTMALVLGMLGLSGVAMADAPSIDDPPRVIELPLTVVHGRHQRPLASYILTRSGQRYEVRELRTSFVREVVRSVDRGPF